MHLLVNRGGFAHDEPAVVRGAGIEDIDGFESHLLQAWLIASIGSQAIRAVGLVDEVVGVDISVEPGES